MNIFEACIFQETTVYGKYLCNSNSHYLFIISINDKKRCIQFLPCADGVNEAYMYRITFKILHYKIHFHTVKSLQHQELTDSMVLYMTIQYVQIIPM